MKIIILVQNHFEFDLFRLNRGLIIVDLLFHHPTHLNLRKSDDLLLITK